MSPLPAFHSTCSDAVWHLLGTSPQMHYNTTKTTNTKYPNLLGTSLTTNTLQRHKNNKHQVPKLAPHSPQIHYNTTNTTNAKYPNLLGTSLTTNTQENQAHYRTTVWILTPVQPQQFLKETNFNLVIKKDYKPKDECRCFTKSTCDMLSLKNVFSMKILTILL